MASPKLKTTAEAHAQLTMEAAAHAVEEMKWSERKSAEIYGVNRRTLSNRLNDRHTGSRGRQPKIPPHEEGALADFLLSCSDTGIPLNRQHCAAAIVEMNIRLGSKYKASNNQHLRRLLKRHPNLSMRITHASNRKKDREWTHELAEKYISKLTELLYDRGFLEEPEQVWNLDESAFNTAEMFDRVVGRKGMRQIYSQFDETEKVLVTILPCGNAAALQLPFMALFSGKLHVRSRLDGTGGHCYQGNVIFVDGHFSHVNNFTLMKYITEFEAETGKIVYVFALPAGQTGHLQPFDISVFGQVKRAWGEYLRYRHNMPGGLVTKDNLLSHLVKLWFHTEDCPPQHAFNAGPNLISGFRKSGLFPFSPEVIRGTVKTRHCPESPVSTAESASKNYQSIFGSLTETLKDEVDIAGQKDREDILDFIKLKQRGVAPGAVLAASLQASLFSAAAKKVRREKNEHLNLDAGGLTNEPAFQSAQAAKRAAVKAAKAAQLAKRKSKGSQEECQEMSGAVTDAAKTARVRKSRSVKRKTSASHEPAEVPHEVTHSVPARQTRAAKKPRMLQFFNCKCSAGSPVSPLILPEYFVVEI
ncbi:hypothetical protein RvY_01665 [Ramazzottius varieornatus]|uniref:HTH psq-type domain-containing protein n=1 Tax=Ramazzottius varieornatus TaxID=947166 RepID=A0A1D1UKJ2_RAMVA|nr:hypothetical protein RvY_01665 [Ramazzottius varieornatus]